MFLRGRCCEPTPLSALFLIRLCQSVMSCSVEVMPIISIDAQALSPFSISSKPLSLFLIIATAILSLSH